MILPTTHLSYVVFYFGQNRIGAMGLGHVFQMLSLTGIDYPRNLQEFDEWFSSEDACIKYLLKLQWPNGFRCPVRHGDKAWMMGRGVLWCVTCGRQTSPIVGTIFEGTRKPLRLWFQAMWYITSQKFGGNALGLQRVLGLGSYQTAWSWLHKMRRAMVRPGRNRLCGNVEVDETLVGGEVMVENVDAEQSERLSL